MDMVFRGGTVVTSHARFPADVYVKGEKIAAIGTDLAVPEGTKTIDATGKLVLPGAIDAHTHLEFPFNGTTSADDYFAGTRAAACGGVTMVFDFVTQRKGQGIREAVQPRNALCAPKACIDYSFHVALTDLTPAVLEEFADAAAAGLPSFKLYMVYKKDGLMMNDADIVAALERSKETGTLIAVHAENPDVIDRNIARMAVYEMQYAETAVDAGVAIDEAIELAKKYGADESPKFLNGVLGAMVPKGQKKGEKK